MIRLVMPVMFVPYRCFVEQTDELFENRMDGAGTLGNRDLAFEDTRNSSTKIQVDFANERHPNPRRI